MAWKVTGSFDDWERELVKGVREAVKKTADEAVAAAAKRAPKDTTALANSGYVVTAHESGYEAAKARVQTLNPQAASEMESEFPFDDLEEGIEQAVVDFPVAYASLIALGFYNPVTKRLVAGRDFLGPSIRSQRHELEKRLSRVLDHLKP